MDWRSIFNMFRQWTAQPYDVERAEASRPEDRDAILDQIRADGQVETINQRLNNLTIRFFESAVATCFFAFVVTAAACQQMSSVVRGVADDSGSNIVTTIAAIIAGFANPL